MVIYVHLKCPENRAKLCQLEKPATRFIRVVQDIQYYLHLTTFNEFPRTPFVEMELISITTEAADKIRKLQRKHEAPAALLTGTGWEGTSKLVMTGNRSSLPMFLQVYDGLKKEFKFPIQFKASQYQLGLHTKDLFELRVSVYAENALVGHYSALIYVHPGKDSYNRAVKGLTALQSPAKEIWQDLDPVREFQVIT